MSTYLLIGIAGYLMGVKHKQLSRRFCLIPWRRHARNLLKMI